MDSRWKRGCGVGCLVLVLVCVALAGTGLWYARQMNADFKVVSASEEELIIAHGVPADWRPATLVPDPARVAAFASVRGDLAEWRERLATHTAHMIALDARQTNRLKHLVDSISTGNELAGLYAGFWTARNEALLAAEMGAGEYVWLYHLTYYAWLGHDPGAGSDQGSWYIGADDEGAREAQIALGDETGDAVRKRKSRARRRMRELVMPMVEETATADDEERAWRSDELARLATEPARYPWQTDLPAGMAAALAPHRAVLESQWDPLINAVELLFETE